MLSIVEAAVHFQVAFDALRKRRPKLLRPNLQVRNTHPRQVLPTRQVNARKVIVENNKGWDKQGEGGAYQECHVHNNLILLIKRRDFLRSHVVDFSTNAEAGE